MRFKYVSKSERIWDYLEGLTRAYFAMIDINGALSELDWDFPEPPFTPQFINWQTKLGWL